MKKKINILGLHSEGMMICRINSTAKKVIVIEPLTKERLTKNDKIKFVSQNFDDMLEQAMLNADDETKEALSREGVTKEEQIDILSAFVTPRELPKHKGSKAANPAGLQGAGTSLTFTDSNVWKQLKADTFSSIVCFVNLELFIFLIIKKGFVMNKITTKP